MQSTLPLDPPANLSRREVIALANETGRAFGLSAAALQVLARLIGSTESRDWKDPDAIPVYFGKQENLADRIGISSRQVRTHEKNLARLGYIDPSPLGNGHRSAAGRWGISLGPLKARISELLARREQLRADHERKRSLKAERSVVRRRATDLLRNADPGELGRDDVARIAERVLAWPRADRLMRLRVDLLDLHVSEAVRDLEALEAVLGAPRTAKPEAAPEERRVRPVLTTETLAKLGDLTKPERVVRLATPAFRDLALSMGTPTEESVIAAAESRRAEIGIGAEAWGEAVVSMGREVATLALVLVDANRDHPRNPIRKPAAALRGLARKFAEGKFNLAGGLIALDRRRRREAGGPGP